MRGTFSITVAPTDVELSATNAGELSAFVMEGGKGCQQMQKKILGAPKVGSSCLGFHKGARVNICKISFCR